MKSLILTLISLMIVSPLQANDDAIQRSLTLNSGYAEGFFNSNEALVHAPLSVIQAYSKLFDVVTGSFRNHWGKRLANILLEVPFSYWLAPALSTPFHEFGHARAVHALGLPYSYGSKSFGYHFKDMRSFWTLSALRLITPPSPLPGSGLAYTAARGNTGMINVDVYRDKGENAGIDLMILSAGLNNQMFLAKTIGTTIYEKNGHPLYLAHYVANKVHGFVYASHDHVEGDPQLAINAYQRKGLDVKLGHLKALSLWSLLSGSTFALLYGYYNYVVNDDDVVRPLEFFGIRLPELNGYINANGLSFEIESDYRISKSLSVGLAYEFIWRGQRAYEVTPRVRYNFASLVPSLNELWFNAAIVIGKGVGGTISAELAPLPFDSRNFWTRFSYSFDMHLHHARSLYGERNIVALNQGNTLASSAYVGFKLRY